MNTTRTKNEYGKIALALLVGGLLAQWVYAWFQYVGEQLALGENLSLASYAAHAAALTGGAWHSIALTVIAQVLALAYLFALIRPESAPSGVSGEIEEIGTEDDEAEIALGVNAGVSAYQVA